MSASAAVIEHIIEPNRLLLVWQSPSRQPASRLVVGELTRASDAVELRYGVVRDDFATAEAAGFRGYPAFPKLDRVYRKGVLDTFMRRLPPRNRQDFARFLEQRRLPADADLSDFALLGYSEARVAGDEFSLMHPFDDVAGPCELLTEIAGFRHHGKTVEGLRRGQPVTLEPEPTSEHDAEAVQVLAEGRRLGYVNRVQLPAFRRWLCTGSVDARIERINGRPDRPAVFIFVRVRPAAQSPVAPGGDRGRLALSP